MSYSPPGGHSVSINFTTAYTPPGANSITVNIAGGITQYIVPSGWLDDTFGSTRAQWNQYVLPPTLGDGSALGTVTPTQNWHYGFTLSGAYTPPTNPVYVVFASFGTLVPHGWDGVVFGAPTVTTTSSFAPSGFATLGFGTAAVWNYNQIAAPSGLSTLAFGTATVYNFNQIASPSGFATLAFGTSSVTNSQRFLSPSGFATLAFGAASIRTLTQWAYPGGFSAAAYGTPWVSHLNRTLSPAGINQTAFGNLNSSGGLRYVDQAGRGIGGPTWGTQFIAYKERRVYPLGMSAGLVGRHTIGTTQYITQTGFEALAWGANSITDNRQLARPAGLYGMAWGVPAVDPNPRHLYPLGIHDDGVFPHGSWGVPDVYRNPRVIAQTFDDQNTDYLEQFGSPVHTLVENRNRTVGAVGERMDHVSIYASVANGAVAIKPPGWDESVLYFGLGLHPPGTGFISYRDRSVTAPGPYDPIVGYITPFHQVTRTPEIDPPSLGNLLGFGTAHIENTRRYFPIPSAGETQQWGMPRVEYLIREVTPTGFDAYQFGVPYGDNLTRYVYPTGFGIEMQLGRASFEEHFNIIETHGLEWGRMGLEHYVRNVTPELRAFGYDMAEFGRFVGIHNQWNYVAPPGGPHTLFGSTDIGPRTKNLTVHGVDMGRISPFTNVRNDTPDPPPTRLVAPPGYYVNDNLKMGTPTVRWNMIFPPGEVRTIWGTPTVTANSIYPQTFWLDLIPPTGQFGTAHLNATQTIDLDGKGMAGAFDAFRAQPRMDPYVIYCTYDVPPGYTTEQSPTGWQPVDDPPSGDLGRPFFGHVSIGNRIRTLYQYHVTDDYAHSDKAIWTEWGTPTVDLKNRVVAEQGWKSFKTGYPLVTHGGEINFDLLHDGCRSELAFGDTTVENFELNRRLRPDGIGSDLWGHNRVELFNREIPVNGLAASLWGSPYVGPPNFRYMQGFIATVWGPGTFIDYRIRHVTPTGFVDEAFGVDPDQFDGRMIVSRRNNIAPAGIAATGFGTPGVQRWVRTLGGAGGFGGGYVPTPTVNRLSIIALGGYGWESSEFGDVWRVEDGLIKCRGWVDDAFGRARTSRTLPQDGWIATVFGDPSMGDVLHPGGFVATAFGANVATGDGLEFTCGQLARALVAGAIAPAGIGTAGVAHG